MAPAAASKIVIQRSGKFQPESTKTWPEGTWCHLIQGEPDGPAVKLRPRTQEVLKKLREAHTVEVTKQNPITGDEMIVRDFKDEEAEQKFNDALNEYFIEAFRLVVYPDGTPIPADAQGRRDFVNVGDYNSFVGRETTQLARRVEKAKAAKQEKDLGNSKGSSAGNSAAAQDAA